MSRVPVNPALLWYPKSQAESVFSQRVHLRYAARTCCWSWGNQGATSQWNDRNDMMGWRLYTGAGWSLK